MFAKHFFYSGAVTPLKFPGAPWSRSRLSNQVGHTSAGCTKSGIFMKPPSRLPSGERVDLVNAEQFCDFRAFEEELASVGTQNFASGRVATEIRPLKVKSTILSIDFPL